MWVEQGLNGNIQAQALALALALAAMLCLAELVKEDPSYNLDPHWLRRRH